MNRLILKIVLSCLLGAIFSHTASAQRQMERLGRGMTAMRSNSTQVYVAWRLLGNDSQDVAFNLYRSANGAAAVKLNASPLSATTDYLDTPPSLGTISYSYSVKPVMSGVEVADIWANALTAPVTLPANPPTRQYVPVPLQPTPDGALDVKFCWVGDLDGDGEFDFVVDRQSAEGFRQFLEAYKRDGTLLWRIDLGPNSFYKYNIEPGSSSVSIGHGDNVTVYDMDGDGKAEVLLRTANGVVFGNGAVVSGGATNNVQFLSVIDGMTGAELARATAPNPLLADGPMNGHMGILYLDGKRPSVVWAAKNRDAANDFHGVITAWDWRSGSLTQRWSWVVLGGLLFIVGSVGAYFAFNHVRVRVQVWLDPFAYQSEQGYQIVQSIFGLSSGGLLGSGWGQGYPQLVPFAKTDFITSALGEELGLMGMIAILLLFAIVVERGARAAVAAAH